MSERKDKDLIEDIINCIDRISEYTENINYTEFLNDYKTQDAVLRNIEIIGEAVKLLSDQIKDKNPQVPWKNIAGTRDILIHDYFGVNIDIVWNIATNEIISLKEYLSSITKQL